MSRPMKDSGIEWLGEIPEHWEVKRLKHVGYFGAGAGFPEKDQGLQSEELPFFKVGDLAPERNRRVMSRWQHSVSIETAKRLRATVFPELTIVFAKIGAALYLNRRRSLEKPSCIDNNMMAFVPDRCDPNWAFFLLMCIDSGYFVNPGAVPSFGEKQIGEMHIGYPPLPEQRAIADFLDAETERIDSLIDNQRRLLDLVCERRQAIITHAVSKGLDDGVAMRDSGIEWLGEIPAHWEVKRLKHLASIEGGQSPKGDDVGLLIDDFDAPPFLQGNAEFSDYNPVPRLFCYIAKRKCFKGDILLSVRAPVGALNVADQQYGIGRGLVAVRCGQADFQTLWYVMQHSVDWLKSVSTGSTYEAVTVQDVANIPIALPPHPEQRAIADHLDAETARIDTLVSKLQFQIELLTERRQAIITAAVTGKLDVSDRSLIKAKRVML